MIHKACMPVYMNSGKIVADGRDGESKVLQEVLADLKSDIRLLKINHENMFSQISCSPIVKDKAVDVLSYDKILQNVIERKIDG